MCIRDSLRVFPGPVFINFLSFSFYLCSPFGFFGPQLLPRQHRHGCRSLNPTLFAVLNRPQVYVVLARRVVLLPFVRGRDLVEELVIFLLVFLEHLISELAHHVWAGHVLVYRLL